MLQMNSTEYNPQATMVVSPTKIALFDERNIMAIDITNEKGARIINKYHFPDQVQIIDAQWHPISTEILMIAFHSQAQNSSFAFYNSTDNTTRTIDKQFSKHCGAIKNGSLLLQSSYKNNVYVYSYVGGQINKVGTIESVSLDFGSVATEANVVATIQIFGGGTVKVYELVEENTQPDSIDRIINSKQKIPTNDSVSFKLIFTKGYSNNVGFSGISSDGNELYLNKDDGIQIKGGVARFRRCIDGTYSKNGQCFNCSINCKTCFNDQKQCTSCLSTKLFYNYECVDCGAKYPGCSTCDYLNCSKFNETANFLPDPQQNKCLCINGTYPINQGRQCQICTSFFIGCKTCVNPTNCTECDQQGHFISDGNGKCKCIGNFTLVDKSCIQCSKMVGCTNCTDTDHCTECNKAANFELNDDGKCQCVQGFWLSQTQCQPCSTKIFDCILCSQDGNTCQSCKSPDRKLNEDNTKCVCEDFKYEDQTKICQLCDPYQNCVNCTDVSNCLECDSNKKWNKIAVDGQCTCQPGYFKDNNACSLCSAPGCLQCESLDECTKCSQEKDFDSEPVKGLCTCKVDTQFDNETKGCLFCKVKMMGCLNCSDLATCTECNTSANLKLKDDHSGCQCVENYFLQNQTCQTCQTFVQYCELCQILQNKVQCNTCDDGFTYNKDTNACECPDGFEIVNQTCKEKPGQNWIIIVIIVGAVILIIVVGLLCFKKIRRKRRPLDFQQEFQPDEIGQIEQEEEKQKDEQRDQISDVERARKALLARSLLSDNSFHKVK